LDASPQYFVDIINFLPDATFVINKEGKVTLWNHALENISGIPAEAMLGKGNYEHALPFYGRRRPMIADLILNPDDDMEKLYSFIRKEKGIHMAETYVPSLGGKERYLSVRATPMYNSKGEMVGAVESFRDLTEKKMLEKALSEEHRRLASILDGSPVSAFVIDRDGRVTAWNMVNEFFTGISKEEVIGKPLDLSPLFKGKASLSLAELVLKMTDEEIIERYGHKGVRKSAIHPEAFESVGSVWVGGKELIMAIQATRLRDAAGNIIGAIQCAQDITEQKKAEEQQRKREKLTALMETAGMICHEMNQPLQAILGQAELLDLALPEGDQCRKRLRTIVEQTERMAGITRSLMKITRYDLKPYVGETKIIDLDKAAN
jgi:PAS domain S-box-containing protein